MDFSPLGSDIRIRSRRPRRTSARGGVSRPTRAGRERLQEEDGAARYGALLTLLHLAYEYRDWPSDVEHLIIRATADPDGDVAGLAERALFQYSRRNDPRLPAEPESVRRKRYDREKLDRVRAILDDPDASHLGAARRLIHLASNHREPPTEIRRLLEQARSDPDFDVANLAESFLAARDDRPMDPALVRPGQRLRNHPPWLTMGW